jgi:hypothetical protein
MIKKINNLYRILITVANNYNYFLYILSVMILSLKKLSIYRAIMNGIRRLRRL